MRYFLPKNIFIHTKNLKLTTMVGTPTPAPSRGLFPDHLHYSYLNGIEFYLLKNLAENCLNNCLVKL